MGDSGVGDRTMKQCVKLYIFTCLTTEAGVSDPRLFLYYVMIQDLEQVQEGEGLSAISLACPKLTKNLLLENCC